MTWLTISRSGGRLTAILHRAGIVLPRSSPTVGGVATDRQRRLEETEFHFRLLRALATRLCSGSCGPINANEPELGDDVCWSTASRAAYDAARVTHKHACVAGVM